MKVIFSKWLIFFVLIGENNKFDFKQKPLNIPNIPINPANNYLNALRIFYNNELVKYLKCVMLILFILLIDFLYRVAYLII